jgi:RNA polymerase sigma-70 factor (ECF subfamily)
MNASVPRLADVSVSPVRVDGARGRTFDALFDRAALDRAYRTARLILLDPVEAEDATHDAVLAAWRHIGELRDPDRFDAWFGRILVNACRDRLRERPRRPVPLDVVEPFTAGGTAPDPADAIATHDLLRAAFRTLSPEHREVVALRYFADLTVDQIAERTGTRSGTVKSRLHHAIRRLREGVGTPETGRFDR